MIKVLLTFDYELPLGRASDYRRALFDPSQKLLELADELGVPIILFADICSAIRFKEWNNQGYYMPFRDQVQDALKRGHDVQLHIHPHWMNSTYRDSEFIPSKDFSLNCFKIGKDGYDIERIIQLAHDELVLMCKGAYSAYSCIAFRAGGYDVEPESKRILNKLYELGIRIESSVIQGFFNNLPYSQIDYRNAPTNQFWFISKDGPLITTILKGEASMLELPITSMPISGGQVAMRLLRKRLYKNEYKSRIYHNTGNGFAGMFTKPSLSNGLRGAFNPVVLTFDRENRDANDLIKIVSYQVHRFRNSKDIYLTTIAHPKSMGQYHLGVMRDFINKMRDLYQDGVSFTTYPSVASDFSL